MREWGTWLARQIACYRDSMRVDREGRHAPMGPRVAGQREAATQVAAAAAAAFPAGIAAAV